MSLERYRSAGPTCPPYPAAIQAAIDLNPVTATDEQLAEAAHLLGNFRAMLEMAHDLLRMEVRRREQEAA